MTKTILATLLLFITCTQIRARENYYTQVFIGYNHLSIPTHEGMKLKTNPGYAVGGSLGYHFWCFTRLELEFSYRKNTFDKLAVPTSIADVAIPVKGSLQKRSYFANAYLDFPLICPIKPYVGAGIGWTHDLAKIKFDLLTNQLEMSKFRSNDNSGLYQIIVGLRCTCLPLIYTQLEYRFLGSKSDRDINHTVDLALKIDF